MQWMPREMNFSECSLRVSPAATRRREDADLHARAGNCRWPGIRRSEQRLRSRMRGHRARTGQVRVRAGRRADSGVARVGRAGLAFAWMTQLHPSFGARIEDRSASAARSGSSRTAPGPADRGDLVRRRVPLRAGRVARRGRSAVDRSPSLTRTSTSRRGAEAGHLLLHRRRTGATG